MKIEIQKPIAHLEATGIKIAIYKPMNWLQRKFVKWLLGLEYRKVS